MWRSLELGAADLSDTQKGIYSLFTFNTKELNSASGQASCRKHSSRTSKAVPAFGIDCGGSDAIS